VTAAHLLPMWRSIAPALGNHLWQSTQFAVVAGLLNLVMRHNHARARYWLWLAASLKFLIPFSLLVGMGSLVSWSPGSPAAQTGLYLVMQEVNQPFAAVPTTLISRISPSVASPSLLSLLPALLIAVWLGGLVAVLFAWFKRWKQISAALREAVPLREGREVEVLSRLQRVSGIRTRIELLLSRAALEPGIFGIARPVLIWPKGISEHLDDGHLEAILAHELWHVRRRDNLAAAMHMVVEAVFWFHPLVWWLGTRLVEERERACDEEVLELGGERQVYAESILKVCEFCVGSPLACVSGVTGADLKKRMVYIMTEGIAQKLDFGRKLLLSAAVLLALAVPIGFGVVNATQGRAEAQTETSEAGATTYKSASIRPHQSASAKVEHVAVMFSPHGFTATNATLQTVLGVAYGVQKDLVSGAPDWVDSDKYDIDVALPDSTAEDAPKAGAGIGVQRLRLMLQALLADRFKLSLHQETRDLSVYELVVAEGGPRLKQAAPAVMNTNGNQNFQGRVHKERMMKMGPGELTGQGATLEPLAEQLSFQLGRTVVNKTGLTGNYDFSLRWTPGESEMGMMKLMGSKPDGDSRPLPEASGPSIFTAIQEQLGLKLEAQTTPMSILVIDHVERPREN
jgi:bla regulator protein BlaR1